MTRPKPTGYPMWLLKSHLKEIAHQVRIHALRLTAFPCEDQAGPYLVVERVDSLSTWMMVFPGAEATDRMTYAYFHSDDPDPKVWGDTNVKCNEHPRSISEDIAKLYGESQS